MRTLLARLSSLVQRWTDASERPGYRNGGVVFGLVAAALVLGADLPGELSVTGQRTAAVTTLMAIWWLGRVLPMAVTAMVPLVAFPLLGVQSIQQAAAPYGHHLIFLMLGGFVLGLAMEEVGLHRRLVAALLRPHWVRQRPARVLLALMVAAGVLSALVSNTATTLMLLPVALSLAHLCAGTDRARSTFALGLAYAASIGGVATLVGTPPNAILAKELPELTFASWMGIGVPFSLIALPAAWWVVSRALPLPEAFDTPPEIPERQPWTRAEMGVGAVVLGAMTLWLTRKPVDLGLVQVPGWSDLLPDPAMVTDAWVAMGAALLLFMLPSDKGAERPFVLSWGETQRRLPWSVLLLLGGGFSLAMGIKSSGLTLWLAGATDGLQLLTSADGPFATTPWLGNGLAILAICASMTLLTELTSNTATTQIVLPVLAAGAASAGVDPALWMVPATISASCAFTMPVATAPNAIASEAGGVSPGDMALAGALLNGVCVFIAAGVAWALV